MSGQTYDDGKNKYRKFSCDVCHKDKPAVVDRDDEGFVFPSVVITNSDPASLFLFAAICTKCDVAVCSQCARWIKNRQNSENTPVCPKCGGPLIGKTTADIKRLNAALSTLDDMCPDEKRRIVPKLLRICQEQEPHIIKLNGQDVLNNIRRGLTEALTASPQPNEEREVKPTRETVPASSGISLADLSKARVVPAGAKTILVYICMGDQFRTARYYASLSRPSAELSGASDELAAHMLTGETATPNPKLAWVLSLLEVPKQAASITADLCEKFMFDLDDALAKDAKPSLRLALFQGVQRVLERLAAADPANVGWQRDLSISHNKVGDVLRAQGGLEGALREYRASLAVSERLAAADPSNTDLQRDLWVLYWKLAGISEKAGQADAITWWRKAYEQLSGMKRRGLFLSPQDEGSLEQLRGKAGSE